MGNDGTAEVWGDAGRGGDASGVTLTNVASIMCGGSACAVLRNDGTGETWGASAWGAGVQLTNIKMCQPATTLPPTTSIPTNSPTTSPSTAPTESPTTSPTTAPSKNPTKSPSKSPSRSPSSAPTAESFLLKIDGFHGSPIDALSDVAKAQKRAGVQSVNYVLRRLKDAQQQ